MSRIASTFRTLKSQKRAALIPFITAGDPEPSQTVPLMHAMVDAGANIIEIGVPFSDPMADGPVIQAACERALAHGVSLKQVLSMVAEFRKHDSDTPVVLMGYLNPIEVMGYENFAKRASAAGVDGVLTVDLPPEEATDFLRHMKSYKIDPIFLLSPTSTEQRIRRVAEAGSGFLYYVSLKGVTGVKTFDINEVAAKVSQVKKLSDLPVGVGFGIRDPESAAQVAKVADAVVVGSALVKRIEQLQEDPDKILEEVPAFLQSLRKAMDR